MGVSKVDFAGNTLVDLTGDSVTPATLKKGETAHNRAGGRYMERQGYAGWGNVQYEKRHFYGQL